MSATGIFLFILTWACLCYLLNIGDKNRDRKPSPPRRLKVHLKHGAVIYCNWTSPRTGCYVYGNDFDKHGNGDNHIGVIPNDSLLYEELQMNWKHPPLPYTENEQR